MSSARSSDRAARDDISFVEINNLTCTLAPKADVLMMLRSSNKPSA